METALAGGQTRPASRPNILLFLPDQHRFDWLGSTAGLPVRTPNIDALAERGVRFTNAICPSPVCVPSRAALASGKEFDRCGTPDNNFNYPVNQVTFYRLLRDSGYFVAGCGKFDLAKPARTWGRDGKQVVTGVSYLDLWGFSDGIDNGGKHDAIMGYKKGQVGPYMAYLESRGLVQEHLADYDRRRRYDDYVTPLPDDAYCDNWIARNGLGLLGQAPSGRPWFLQVNFNGPHEPMDVTASMKDRWKDVKFPSPNNGPPELDHDGIRQNYSGMVENIDRWVGIYIEHLAKTGQLDNTLIVYSSDHGEMLGDHRRWGKSVPYQPSVGVPLVIAGPGVRSGWVCQAPVTTLDLTATFLGAAGLSIPDDMDSRSMGPMLAGEAAPSRKIVRSGLGGWRMAYDGRYKLIRGFDAPRTADDPEPLATSATADKVLLFDLKTDPLERTDIAAGSPQIVERLTSEL